MANTWLSKMDYTLQTLSWTHSCRRWFENYYDQETHIDFLLCLLPLRIYQTYEEVIRLLELKSTLSDNFYVPLYVLGYDSNNEEGSNNFSMM